MHPRFAFLALTLNFSPAMSPTFNGVISRMGVHAALSNESRPILTRKFSRYNALDPEPTTYYRNATSRCNSLKFCLQSGHRIRPIAFHIPCFDRPVYGPTTFRDALYIASQSHPSFGFPFNLTPCLSRNNNWSFGSSFNLQAPSLFYCSTVCCRLSRLQRYMGLWCQWRLS